MPLLVRGFGLVILSSNSGGAHFLVLVFGSRKWSSVWVRFVGPILLNIAAPVWGPLLGLVLWSLFGFWIVAFFRVPSCQ